LMGGGMRRILENISPYLTSSEPEVMNCISKRKDEPSQVMWLCFFGPIARPPWAHPTEQVAIPRPERPQRSIRCRFREAVLPSRGQQRPILPYRHFPGSTHGIIRANPPVDRKFGSSAAGRCDGQALSLISGGI
jgi:hypothetical protein